jgi:hypothetical protein
MKKTFEFPHASSKVSLATVQGGKANEAFLQEI